MADLEADFRAFIKQEWLGWMEFYEPRRGSGVGFPDMQILAYHKLIPIELKIATLKGDKIYSSPFSPAQIGWHKRFSDNGGIADVWWGVKEQGKWKAFSTFSFDGDRLIEMIVDWKSGYLIGDEVRQVYIKEVSMIVNPQLIHEVAGNA